MKIYAGRNTVEWAIMIATMFILLYFVYPLYYSAMAKDLRIDGIALYVSARYLVLIAIIGISGLTAGFNYMEEMRSNAIAGRKGKNFSARSYFFGSLLLLTLFSTIALDGYAIWYFDIKEVSWKLGYLVIKSAIWQASSMGVTLAGGYLRDLERRRRVGMHAVKVKS